MEFHTGFHGRQLPYDVADTFLNPTQVLKLRVRQSHKGRLEGKKFY